jgi:hypothetical protein
MGLALILSALALLFIDRATRGFAVLTTAFVCVWASFSTCGTNGTPFHEFLERVAALV